MKGGEYFKDKLEGLESQPADLLWNKVRNIRQCVGSIAYSVSNGGRFTWVCLRSGTGDRHYLVLSFI